MITKTVKVEIPEGIHMRIAAKIVEILKQNKGRLEFYKNGIKADARSVLELLILEATYHSSVTVTAEGQNEEKMINDITLLLMDGAGI